MPKLRKYRKRVTYTLEFYYTSTIHNAFILYSLFHTHTPNLLPNFLSFSHFSSKHLEYKHMNRFIAYIDLDLNCAH